MTAKPENPPKVSVLMPVYNAAPYLAEAIESVLTQTFTDFEFCILDNHSTDASLSLISRYLNDPRIRLFKNETTLPIYENFMAVYRHSNPKTKWIKYALADDILLPRCLEEMIRVGDSDKDIGLVSALRQDLHLNGTLETKHYGLDTKTESFEGSEILKSHFLQKISVCGSPHNVMYLRSTFSEANGFKTQYMHADTELAYRLLDSHKFGFLHKPLTITRVHINTASTFATWYGINFVETFRFTFANLHAYKSIKLSPSQIRQLRDYFVDAISHNLLRLCAHFQFRAVLNLLPGIPKGSYPYLAERLPKVLVTRLWKHISGLDGGKRLITPRRMRPTRASKAIWNR